MQRFVLPTVARLTRVKAWEEYKRMMQLEALSIHELKRYHLTKLREILNHAYERVPFYRQRFQEIGFDTRGLEDDGNPLPIPPTTKEDIMSHFPEGITAQGLDRTQWKYVASSGTTRQIMGIHDFKKANTNWAAGLRAYKLAGNHTVGKRWMEIPPHMCTNICGVDDSDENARIFSRELLSLLITGKLDGLGQHIYQYYYSRRQKIYRRFTLPSFGSEGTNIPENEFMDYINTIRTYQPHLLEGLPLYLFAFAKHFSQRCRSTQ